VVFYRYDVIASIPLVYLTATAIRVDICSTEFQTFTKTNIDQKKYFFYSL